MYQLRHRGAERLEKASVCSVQYLFHTSSVWNAEQMRTHVDIFFHTQSSNRQDSRLCKKSQMRCCMLTLPPWPQAVLGNNVNNVTPLYYQTLEWQVLWKDTSRVG